VLFGDVQACLPNATFPVLEASRDHKEHNHDLSSRSSSTIKREYLVFKTLRSYSRERWENHLGAPNTRRRKHRN
jgi:hypothetical protein